jgi:ectoine hydroxylase-related dioxygenase (phytanoyl-CoA dioxygenase family)
VCKIFDGDTWQEPELWKRTCPELSISIGESESTNDCATILATNGKFPTSDSDVNINSEEKKWKNTDEATSASSDMLADGYSLIDDFSSSSSSSTTIPLPQLISSLSSGVSQLVGQGWPACMILLFDETWRVARHATHILQAATHSENALNFDLLAWHIDPQKNESGFSPHRDRQPDDLLASFHPPAVIPADATTTTTMKREDTCDSVTATAVRTVTGHAKYATLWLALTDATPENSCLYIIPAPHDPGYFDGDDDACDEEAEAQTGGVNVNQKQSLTGKDPLSKALPSKESYQNIRALPRQAGQAVIFSHRILHWGSKGNSNPTRRKHIQPRIAISFVASHASFEKPYVDPKYLSITESTLPPFRIRLLLVCSQLLIYYQRFDLSKSTLRVCYNYVKANESELEETYRKKVYVEFVKAMKEAQTVSVDGVGSLQETTQQSSANINNESDDVVDDEDAMLEEMLNAETEGYGDFEDDFDNADGASADYEDDDDDSSSEEDEYEDITVDDLIKKRKACPDIKIKVAKAKRPAQSGV